MSWDRARDCWCRHAQPAYTVANGPLGLLARTRRVHSPTMDLVGWACANVPGKGTSYSCSIPLVQQWHAQGARARPDAQAAMIWPKRSQGTY